MIDAEHFLAGRGLHVSDVHGADDVVEHTECHTVDEVEERCRQTALRSLDRAARSSASMHARLVEKGYADDIAGRVVVWLCANGYIDDEAYARDVLAHGIQRGLGRRAAMEQLRQRCIPDAIALCVCNEAQHQGLFVQAAYELGERVARRTLGKPYDVRRRRWWSAARSKGHDSEIIRQLEHELFDDATQGM